MRKKDWMAFPACNEKVVLLMAENDDLRDKVRAVNYFYYSALGSCLTLIILTIILCWIAYRQQEIIENIKNNPSEIQNEQK